MVLPALRPPAGVAYPLAWRRPSRLSDGVVDVVEVAEAQTAAPDGAAATIGVFVRSSLDPTAFFASLQAWADIRDAIKAGEFDDLPTGETGGHDW